jgi:ABC-2 type transport system permease protein
MSVSKVLSVTRKEIRHIVRDRMTLLLVTLSPVFFLVILAYSLSVSITNVGIAVLDQDRSQLSRDYISRLTTSGDLVIRQWLNRYDQASQVLERGQARAVVIIPPNFEQDMVAWRKSQLQVLVDGTDPNTAGHALTHVVARTEAFVARLSPAGEVQEGQTTSRSEVIDLRLRVWYNPTLDYNVGMVPALLAVVLGLPAMSVSLTIAREREWGTLEQLITTPVKRGELLVGKVIPYVVSGLVSAILCALVAVTWFDVPFRGSFAVYLLLAALFLFATQAIGLLVSVLANSQSVAVFASLLIFLFPGFFLSGIFIPLASMGPLMKMESLMMPTTHFVFISRGIFVKGLGLTGLWGYGAALVVMGLLFLGLTILLFKKRL